MVNHALAFIVGSIFAFFSSDLIDTFWFSYLPIILFLAFLVPKYRFLFLILAAFLLAGLQLHLALNLKLQNDFDNRIVFFSGTIADIPKVRPQSTRLLIKPDNIQGYHHALPEKIRLSWYHNKQIPAAGESWQFKAKLKRPAGYQNPAGFDYDRWLLVKGIGATGYVKASAQNKRIEVANWWDINRWRSSIAQTIDQHCRGCNNNGLIKALSIGYRGDINALQNQTLQNSGTAHLLAISGLHIGLVAGLFYLLGGWLWRHYFFRFSHNQLEFSAVLSLCAGFSYAALAGFSIPTVRALIMLGVICFALKYRVKTNLLNAIATAVVLILIIDPLAVGSASFWLSIGALLIIALAQYLMRHQQGWLRKLALIQLLFTLIFIPMGILLFDQINSAGFFANLISIPLISFVLLPLVLIAIVCASINLPFAESLLTIADRGLTLLFDYLQWLLGSGLSVFQTGMIPAPLLACALVGLILLLMPRSTPGKAPALLLLLLPIFWQPEKAEYGSYRMTVLDVGMGTAIVVETQNHSLVYDYGPGNDQGFSAGSWVVKPFLQYQNRLPPDLMIISHVDQDHSGGFQTFKLDYDPSRLISGTPDEIQRKFKLESAIRSCHDQAPWRWDGVQFEFLPLADADNLVDSNNRSCVLKIQGHHSTLLAGDIEAERENWLVKSNTGRLKADVLVVPHHGSLTSSTLAFVESVRPSVAIFTVGKDNRWGFPKSAVVARYRAIASQIYRTDVHGAVSFTSTMDRFRVESQRQRRPRLWH
jgi:competence protein ComEC